VQSLQQHEQAVNQTSHLDKEIAAKLDQQKYHSRQSLPVREITPVKSLNNPNKSPMAREH
jgi:hypothetical protein